MDDGKRGLRQRRNEDEPGIDQMLVLAYFLAVHM